MHIGGIGVGESESERKEEEDRGERGHWRGDPSKEGKKALFYKIAISNNVCVLCTQTRNVPSICICSHGLLY